MFSSHNFSTILSLAQVERELAFCSSALASMGLRFTSFMFALCPHVQIGKPGGQMHPVDSNLNTFLTILSSSEWNESTAILPPLFSALTRNLSVSPSPFSSPLTSILIAWNVFFEAPPLLNTTFFGKASSMILLSSSVVSMGRTLPRQSFAQMVPRHNPTIS